MNLPPEIVYKIIEYNDIYTGNCSITHLTKRFWKKSKLYKSLDLEVPRQHFKNWFSKIVIPELIDSDCDYCKRKLKIRVSLSNSCILCPTCYISYCRELHEEKLDYVLCDLIHYNSCIVCSRWNPFNNQPEFIESGLRSAYHHHEKLYCMMCISKYSKLGLHSDILASVPRIV